jgi:Flp pilus assembly protein TadG
MNDRRNSSRPRRAERGATLVEAALVMIPLFVIIFGIIEFGLLFKDQLSASNAVRAAARKASVEPASGTFYTDAVASIKQQGTGVQFHTGDQLCIYAVTGTANTNGTVDSGCTNDAQRYTYGASGWSLAGSDHGTSWPDGGAKSTCLGGQLDSVGVQLTIHHHSVTGVVPINVTLHERAVLRLEPQAQSPDC